MLDVQNVFCCHNRFVLLIFSLLCTIIVLTQQSVALTIPPQPATASSSSSASSYESLVMIFPEVSGSNDNNKMASELEEGTGFNKKAADVLTPGQQVVNAVPVEGKFYINFKFNLFLLNTFSSSIPLSLCHFTLRVYNT